MLVRQAIKDGRLKHKPCKVCGDEKVHAYHKDYSKPLQVVWLCHSHHQKLHADIARAKRDKEMLRVRAVLLYEEGLALREIGEILNRSHEWVRQIVLAEVEDYGNWKGVDKVDLTKN
jgi:hypothetical protein